MQLSLNPPSGHDNSYYDVAFIIQLNNDERGDNAKISLWNTTINQQLNIIASDCGTVVNEQYIICKKTPTVITGYINLFNEDKLNVQLEKHVNINIKCVIEYESRTIEETIPFYNESYSSDRKVLPFFVDIPRKYHLDSGDDFIIDLITQEETSINFQLHCVDNNRSFDFHVFSKNGKLSIHIPPEIIAYELFNLKQSDKNISLYYMKRHGVNYFNSVNRKKIPIPNCSTMVYGKLSLKPQTRNNPIGEILSYDDFPPSDRYFVPVNKDYSYIKLPKINSRTWYGSVLKNEILDIQTSEYLYEEEKDDPLPVKEKNFFADIYNVYINKNVQTLKSLDIDKGGKKDCGCSRKNKSSPV